MIPFRWLYQYQSRKEIPGHGILPTGFFLYRKEEEKKFASLYQGYPMQSSWKEILVISDIKMQLKYGHY